MALMVADISVGTFCAVLRKDCTRRFEKLQAESNQYLAGFRSRQVNTRHSATQRTPEAELTGLAVLAALEARTVVAGAVAVVRVKEG